MVPATILLLFLSAASPIGCPMVTQADSVQTANESAASPIGCPTVTQADSVRRETVKVENGTDGKRPGMAIGATLGVNAVYTIFNRAFLSDPCYRSDWSSIKNNFQTGWVWDNDSFVQNQAGHPYQGSMYYNAVRSNGYGYWTSGLGTILGSLSWEYFCETDPPSINDLLTTTAGGMAVGEVFWRLSDLIIDDSAAGRERFWREVAALAVNPVRGVNRVLRGQAWARGAALPGASPAVSITAGLGARALRAGGSEGPAAGAQAYIGIEYGEPFDVEGKKPYDWFTLTLKAGACKNSSALQQVSILGRLYGKSWRTNGGSDVLLGLFQHFNYYDLPQMEVSESNSFGPGVIIQFRDKRGVPATRLQMHLGAVVMGGISSDYYKVLKRDYNMGSGYSLKGSVSRDWKHVSASLDLSHYQIFTSREYDHAFDDGKSRFDPLYLNAPGAKGHSTVDMAQLNVDIRCAKNLCISIMPAYYFRSSHYDFHPDAQASLFDITLGLGVSF